LSTLFHSPHTRSFSIHLTRSLSSRRLPKEKLDPVSTLSKTGPSPSFPTVSLSLYLSLSISLPWLSRAESHKQMLTYSQFNHTYCHHSTWTGKSGQVDG
jgi:hypothetical protein